ncbi:MAG: polysaccharide deacetylase family protein [Comamonadaceae bacterium]
MSIPILMYHQIDIPPARGTPLRGLVVSPGAFSRQMFLLKCMGYMGLSMRNLEPFLRGERQGRVVGITFDDGYQNIVQNALPVLIKRGFSATCYAVSSMMGGINSWDRGTGVAPKPLMTATDWRMWLDSGMEVGSHTRTHADLAALGAAAANNEITTSRQELEDNLGCEVRHFCYPYGRFDATHRQMVQQAGYATATTTRRGRAQPGDDPFALPRVLVAQSTHWMQFALKISTPYEDRRG